MTRCSRALAYGVPVVVESTCAAPPWPRHGAGQLDGTLFYVSWGTGISSTLVRCGEYLRGRRGEAIGLGRVRPGVCGRCANGPTPWRRSPPVGVSSGVTPNSTAERSRLPRDHRARRSWATRRPQDRCVREPQRSHTRLRACVALLDPDSLVLGGGIGCSDSLLPRLVSEELATLLTRPNPPRCGTSELWVPAPAFWVQPWSAGNESPGIETRPAALAADLRLIGDVAAADVVADGSVR